MTAPQSTHIGFKSISSLIAAWLGWQVVASGLMAEETVVFRPKGQAEQRRTGTVVDYTGEHLLLRHPSGREERIPSEQIIEVRGDWSPGHQAGNAAFDDRRYEAAEAAYRQALQEEKRRWVQRRLWAQLTRCYRYLGQPDKAAQVFLLLHRDDPTTPYFDAVPLTWITSAPSAEMERRAAGWLAEESSAARLIGASWLLTGSRRGEALRTLRQLAADPDSRVAFLAEAQLWRTETPLATETDLARWQQRIDQMPPSLRGGPYFVLGQGLSHRQQSASAALAFLRPVVLHPLEREIIPPALLAAGRELEKMNQPHAAAGLYRELVTEHSHSPLAAEAQQRWQALLTAP